MQKSPKSLNTITSNKKLMVRVKKRSDKNFFSFKNKSFQWTFSIIVLAAFVLALNLIPYNSEGVFLSPGGEDIKIVGYTQNAEIHQGSAELYSIQWNDLDDAERDAETKEEIYTEFPRLSLNYAKLVDGVYKDYYTSLDARTIKGGNTRNKVIIGSKGKYGGILLMANTKKNDTNETKDNAEKRVKIWYSGKKSSGVYSIDVTKKADIDTDIRLQGLEIVPEVHHSNGKSLDVSVEEIKILSSFAGYPYSGAIPHSRVYGDYLKQGSGTGESSAATILPKDGRYIISEIPQGEPVFLRMKFKAGNKKFNEQVQFIVPQLSSEQMDKGINSAKANIRFRTTATGKLSVKTTVEYITSEKA